MFIYQKASFGISKHWVNFSKNEEFVTYGLLISFMVCNIRFNWKMVLISFLFLFYCSASLKKKKPDNNFLTRQYHAKLEKKYLTHFYI